MFSNSSIVEPPYSNLPAPFMQNYQAGVVSLILSEQQPDFFYEKLCPTTDSLSIYTCIYISVFTLLFKIFIVYWVTLTTEKKT